MTANAFRIVCCTVGQVIKEMLTKDVGPEFVKFPAKKMMFWNLFLSSSKDLVFAE